MIGSRFFLGSLQVGGRSWGGEGLGASGSWGRWRGFGKFRCKMSLGEL